MVVVWEMSLKRFTDTRLTGMLLLATFIKLENEVSILYPTFCYCLFAGDVMPRWYMPRQHQTVYASGNSTSNNTPSVFYHFHPYFIF